VFKPLPVAGPSAGGHDDGGIMMRRGSLAAIITGDMSPAGRAELNARLLKLLTETVLHRHLGLSSYHGQIPDDLSLGGGGRGGGGGGGGASSSSSRGGVRLSALSAARADPTFAAARAIVAAFYDEDAGRATVGDLGARALRLFRDDDASAVPPNLIVRSAAFVLSRHHRDEGGALLLSAQVEAAAVLRAVVLPDDDGACGRARP